MKSLKESVREIGNLTNVKTNASEKEMNARLIRVGMDDNGRLVMAYTVSKVVAESENNVELPVWFSINGSDLYLCDPDKSLDDNVIELSQDENDNVTYFIRY